MKLITPLSKPSLDSLTFTTVSRYQSTANLIVNLIPREGSVLHVGCGDGGLARRLASILPRAKFRGVERFVCKGSQIPIHGFNGTEIPFGDNSFDTVLLVDALHDSEDPANLLREAARVAREAIVLKDKSSRGLLASTRRLIDRVGSEQQHGPRAGRLSKSELQKLIAELGLTIEQWSGQPGRFNNPKADWIFRRVFPFTALLSVDA